MDFFHGEGFFSGQLDHLVAHSRRSPADLVFDPVLLVQIWALLLVEHEVSTNIITEVNLSVL